MANHLQQIQEHICNIIKLHGVYFHPYHTQWLDIPLIPTLQGLCDMDHHMTKTIHEYLESVDVKISDPVTNEAIYYFAHKYYAAWYTSTPYSSERMAHIIREVLYETAPDLDTSGVVGASINVVRPLADELLFWVDDIVKSGFDDITTIIEIPERGYEPGTLVHSSHVNDYRIAPTLFHTIMFEDLCKRYGVQLVSRRSHAHFNYLYVGLYKMFIRSIITHYLTRRQESGESRDVILQGSPRIVADTLRWHFTTYVSESAEVSNHLVQVYLEILRREAPSFARDFKGLMNNQSSHM